MRHSPTNKGTLFSNCAYRACERAQQGLQSFCKESTHCRECNEHVSPFEKTCPRCGASSPVVVSVRPFALPVAVGLLALALVFLVL